MRELNLDQLRTLVAVVDLGGFSAAARGLHLAQPTVSLHVAELESRLATPLLARGGRRVTPTGAGEALVERARRLLRDADAAVEVVRDHRDGRVGRVRLGCSAGATVHVLPRLLEALERAHPGIAVHVTMGRSAEMMDRLFVGDCDLALVAAPQPPMAGVTLTPWRSTPVVALLPPRWNGPRTVTPQWLARRPLIFNEPSTHIHQQAMAWFAAGGEHPRGRIEILHNEVARGLVAAGYGAALLPFEDPSEDLGGRIHVARLRPALTRRLAIAHRDPKALGEATRRVLETVRSFRPEAAG